jgi:hypothetical protein
MGSKSSEAIQRRDSACSPNARSPFVVDRNFLQVGSPTIKKSEIEPRVSDISEKPLTMKDLE